jgi:hypothetical protein
MLAPPLGSHLLLCIAVNPSSCVAYRVVGALLTTAACSLDLVSPFSLYFNWNLILYKFQVC